MTRPWLSTASLARSGEGFPLAGVIAVVVVATGRVAWNATNPNDLFIDSWVLVHILRGLTGETDLLPRSVLTLHYPLSYLPFYPFALVFGAFDTVKYIYPVVGALAVLPLYLMMGRGPAALAGAAAVTFLPDLLSKTLMGTPQGIALPLFLLALYFTIRKRRGPFIATAAAILFTHHLTGFITLIMYYCFWVVPRSREPGFLRTEWPSLLFFAAWPLYWTWSFSNTGQAYMAWVMISMTAAAGVPAALLLFAAASRILRGISWLGGRLAPLPPGTVAAVGAAVVLVGGLGVGTAVMTPGLAANPLLTRAVVALLAGLLFFGGLAAFTRRDAGTVVFAATLLALGAVTITVGCQVVFPGLRVVDYALAGGLVALFSPGLDGRWAARPLLAAVACMAILAGVLNFGQSYDRLFANTPGQMESAEWIRAETPANAAFATDAKMSLLILGAADRYATFEGTWWLFSGEPIAPYVAALNQRDRFRDRPIGYVVLGDYMFDQGAEVDWFSANMEAGPEQVAHFDEIGRRVYDREGVTIWELDADVVAEARRGPAPVFSRPGAGLLGAFSPCG